MVLILCTILWALGAVLFTRVVQRLRAMNPDRKLPLWFGSSAVHSGRVFLQRGLAMLLMFPALYAWSDVVGLWSLLLLAVGCAPAIVLNVRHNHQVEAAAGSPSE